MSDLRITGLAAVTNKRFTLEFECEPGMAATEALQERCAAARNAFKETDQGYARFRRCQAVVAETEAKLAQAQKDEEEAAEAKIQANRQGYDPAPHEKAIAAAKALQGALKARLGEQRDALEAARVAARPAWLQWRREFTNNERAAAAKAGMAALEAIQLDAGSENALVKAAGQAVLLMYLSPLVVQDLLSDWPG